MEDKILVDSREDQKILLLLQKENIPYEVKTLDIFDYVIGDVGIERKTISDFVSSSYGHLQEQIINALNNKEHIRQIVVALIGAYDDLFWLRVKTNQEGFYGMLASLTMKYKVSIIHFKRETQFITYLRKCLEKKDGEINFTKIKKLDFKDNTELSLLCALPNISVIKAQKILEKYNIKLILTDKENNGKVVEHLKELDGFGNKIIQNLKPYFL